MMNYRITIKRTEPNPKYAQEIAEFEKSHRGFARRDLDDPYPGVQREFVKDVLITEITEEQFAAIRKAILEKF